MSYVTCPCGFRADGLFREANAAYRAHGCQYHEAEDVDQDEPPAHTSWAAIVGWIALLVFLSFVCTHGWGRFR